MPSPSSANPPARPRKLRVTVLCGGPSAEREISLASGQAVAEALRRNGHDVFVADIGPDQLAALDQPADVVFPALHGPFGEDGTVQRLLAERDLPFVGSDARASALAMDKAATKEAVIAAGIPTPAYEVWDAVTLRTRPAPRLRWPVIVKPVDQGSSVATNIVREAAGDNAELLHVHYERGGILYGVYAGIVEGSAPAVYKYEIIGECQTASVEQVIEAGFMGDGHDQR